MYCRQLNSIYPSVDAVFVPTPKPTSIEADIPGLPSHETRVRNSLSMMFPLGQLVPLARPYLDDFLNPYSVHPGQFSIGYRVSVGNLYGYELKGVELRLQRQSVSLGFPVRKEMSQLYDVLTQYRRTSFTVIFDPRDFIVPLDEYYDQVSLIATPIAVSKRDGHEARGAPFITRVKPSYNAAQLNPKCLTYSSPISAWGRAPLMRLLRKYNDRNAFQRSDFPLTNSQLQSMTMRCNDASLPFGGEFPQHAGHKNGMAIDARYFGADPENYDADHAANRSADVRSVFNYISRKHCSTSSIANCLNSSQIEQCLFVNPSSPECLGDKPVPSTAAQNLADWANANRYALSKMKCDPELGQDLTVIISDGKISTLTDNVGEDSTLNVKQRAAFDKTWQWALLLNRRFPFNGLTANGNPAFVRLLVKNSQGVAVPLATFDAEGCRIADMVINKTKHLNHIHLQIQGSSDEKAKR